MPKQIRYRAHYYGLGSFNIISESQFQRTMRGEDTGLWYEDTKINFDQPDQCFETLVQAKGYILNKLHADSQEIKFGRQNLAAFRMKDTLDDHHETTLDCPPVDKRRGV